jgi:uncharacterized protein YndB with AHSA1/START domain
MRSVESTIEIKCSPERALQAFADEKDLRNWWKVSKALVHPQPGGVYALIWQLDSPDIRYATTGVVRFYVPGKELLINNMVYMNHEKRTVFGPMELYLTVSKNGDNSCILHLVQNGYLYGGEWDWYYDSVLTGWPYALGLLKDYLEQVSGA